MKEISKIILAVLTFSLASLVFADEGLTTSALPATPESETSVVNTDGSIASNINTLYAHEPALSGFGLSATVNNGVATISGNVDSKAQANTAINMARSVEGVSEVRSNITIRNSSQ